MPRASQTSSKRRGPQKRPKPLTLDEKRQIARQPKEPVVIPDRTVAVLRRAQPTHLAYHAVVFAASEFAPGQYIVGAPKPCRELETLRQGVSSLQKRVVAGRSPWGIALSNLDIMALLLKTRQELVAVKEGAVAQKKAFQEQQAAIKRNEERQAKELMFSAAFGGVLADSVVNSWDANIVAMSNSALPEYKYLNGRNFRPYG